MARGDRHLKSVHITNYYHAESGGISTVYNRLLDEANRQRREVRLIVPGEWDEEKAVGEFARIYFVKAIKAPVFDRRYRLILPQQYLLKKSPVRKILEYEKPDVIEIADKYLLLFLAGAIKRGKFESLKRPMLVHMSCERMEDNIRAFLSGSSPFRWFARKYVGNLVAPMYDHHFANSHYTAREILDAVPSAFRENRKNAPNGIWRYFRSTAAGFEQRVHVAKCGVDEVLFNPSRKNVDTRRRILGELQIPTDAVVLLYAGRLSPEKNIKLIERLFSFVQEFRRFDAAKRDFRLIVAGDGPKANWLKNKLIRNAPGKSILLGHITDREYLADLYATADIFLHPNPREPFGIGPLEAMASGTPVVVPDSGGVLTYANKENAWIRGPDTQFYFQAVMDILNNPEKRDRKTAEALETVKQFTWRRSTRRNFRLYDELYAEFKAQLTENKRSAGASVPASHEKDLKVPEYLKEAVK